MLRGPLLAAGGMCDWGAGLLRPRRAPSCRDTHTHRGTPVHRVHSPCTHTGIYIPHVAQARMCIHREPCMHRRVPADLSPSVQAQRRNTFTRVLLSRYLHTSTGTQVHAHRCAYT